MNSFLRWVGSKKILLPEIVKFIPKYYNNYHEPFLGSGVIFFNLMNCPHSYLSDLNEPLINCFNQIKVNVEGVLNELKRFENSKDLFLRERNAIYSEDHKRAAQFIFLNRTSFNGIYRVNQKGLYNVPFGYRPNVDLITSDLLYEVHKKLQLAEIQCRDFETSLINIRESDLVYMDPPYTIAHQNNGFIEYNQKIFSWQDQIRLHDFIRVLDERKVYYILSNAAHAQISNLYKDLCDPIVVNRFSKIGGIGAKRGMVSEYIFTNLPIQ